jgi:NTP pyrophosphatase (non-canonical NTP hydrolase)
MMKFEDIENLVRLWGTNVGIYKQSDDVRQLKKLFEEFLELMEAVLVRDQKKIVDSVGDMEVVLTHIAAFNGYTLTGCYEHAYDEIKDRKGKMVNGIFVKEEDFPDKYEFVKSQCPHKEDE